MDNDTISEMFTDIHDDLTRVRVDIASMQTDIVWVKRIVGVIAIAAASYYGLDVSGVV